MDKQFIEEKAQKIKSLNGIHIYSIKTNKFKTNSINIFFIDKLSKVNASKNALLPAVLRRGCKVFPNQRDISLKLEELYGAAFDCGVSKKGELQIMQFYVDHICDQYKKDNINLFESAAGLLMNIITEPLTENEVFIGTYVEQEKENLINRIESRVNDKAQYAIERCFEEMCKDEPFSVYEYGEVNDIKKINSKKLMDHYKYFIESLPIYVFVSGDISDENINTLIEKLTLIKRQNVKEIKFEDVSVEANEVKEITDKMDVQQGKLSLGFRTNTSSYDEDYFTLAVYNGILGGGIHSKLFQNVREKAGLAYYAFSRLEKFKGLMVVGSGIEISNKDKAIKIILEQMKEIKNSNISDYELAATIKSFETGLKSLKDNQLSIVDFYLSQELLKTNDTFDTMIEKISKVKKEDVVKISEKINLDTIYFLTN